MNIRIYQSASGEWIATDDNGTKLITEAQDAESALAAFRTTYPDIAAQVDADAAAEEAARAERRERQVAVMAKARERQQRQRQ